jgi:hypothetical protein
LGRIQVICELIDSRCSRLSQLKQNIELFGTLEISREIEIACDEIWNDLAVIVLLIADNQSLQTAVKYGVLLVP